MELALGVFYIVLFLAQLIMLILAMKKPETKLWPKLFRLEILSALIAAGLMFLFDRLPGGGMMPGLTYFAEFFYSLAAAAVYGMMTLISIAVRIFKS